jgi:hypothetical protein
MKKAYKILALIAYSVVALSVGYQAGYQKSNQDKEEYAQNRFIEIFLWATKNHLIIVNTNAMHDPAYMQKLQRGLQP